MPPIRCTFFFQNKGRDALFEHIASKFCANAQKVPKALFHPCTQPLLLSSSSQREESDVGVRQQGVFFAKLGLSIG